MESVKITVTGRVQHVGFRWAVAQLASRFSIIGFVKNLPNGDVYIEAQGDKISLYKFTNHVRHNPALLSKVDYLDIVNQPLQSFTDFKIVT